MITVERERFLAELAISGNIQFACVAAGVTRKTAYWERSRNPAFEAEWRRAAAVAAARLSERIAA